MRIEKIEITGFKSFKDKTVLEFQEGTTGIVGPNGCGKSNIVDALLWVMGETSPKHLRSSSMSDVIFSGTYKESPSPSAQVSLFLKKEKGGIFPEKYKEFSEIMITRRATRQGESEYSINNQTCLLRDIQEIFMDTGAGCRGFSIIEQDAIEKLITSKPHERRFIIEEVAGITKFKSRKSESIRKLDRVNQNAQRIDDIIRTQEKQLNQLSRQAKKAEEYRNIKTEIRKREWELSSRLLNDMEQKQEELKDKESLENKKREQLKASKEEEQDRLKILQQELQEKEQLLGKDQSYLSELNCKVVEKGKDIEKSNLAIQIYNENLKTDYNSQESSLKEIQNNEDQLRDIGEQEHKLESKKEILREDLNKTNQFSINNQDGAQLSQKKEELESQLQKNTEERIQTTIQKKVIEASFSTMKTERGRLKNEVLSVEEQIRKTIQEKNQTASTLQKSQNIKFDLNKNIPQLLRTVQDLRKNESALQREQEELRKEVALLTYKIQGMQNLIHKFEGLGSGTQALLNWDSKKFKLLFKELKIEAGFEEAAEAALGPYLQALIPQDKTSIDQGIRYLKENKKGKSSFLSSLPSVQESSFDKQKLKKYPAFICVLSEKIKLNLEMESLYALASHTIVVSNLSSAFELKAQFPSLQFVTKTGERITKESFVYGGSHKDEIHLLKIQNQIKQFSEELRSKERLLEVKKSEQEAITQRLEKTEPDLEKVKNKNSQSEVLNASYDKELEQIERELLRLTEQKFNYQKQEKTLDLNEQKQRVALEEAHKKEKELGLLIQKADSFLSHTEKAYKNYQNYKNQKTELEVKLFTNSKEDETLKQNKQMLLDSIKKLHYKNKDLIKLRDEVQNKIQKEESSIVDIQKELDIYLEEKEQIIKSIEVHQTDFKSKKEDFEEHADSLNKIYENQTLFEKQQNEFRSEYEKLELQKQNLKDKLFENHQIKLEEDVLISEYEELSLENLKKSTQELLNKLTKISEVNLIALKEYEELEQEFTFLKNQREDLFNSQRELNKVITHIDQLCEKRFKNMLDEINLRFSRVFPIIFEGEDAEARLVLVEDSARGEDGVDILVRPPGKKSQNVSLLSRGEKALTSLCLIYSLFLVKPSPFCVLDEIDAPLDDANVFRFISIMKEMARKSQLIVITHNKHTMKSCSHLYGVTMAEKGLSQIVSVNLKGLEAPQPTPAP